MRRIVYLIDAIVARVFFMVLGLPRPCGIKLLGVPIIRVSDTGNLLIGEDVVLCSSAARNSVGLIQRVTIRVVGGGHIIIGNRTGISGATIVARYRVEIGEDVLIGSGALIMDNDAHSLNADLRRNSGREGVASKPVFIGRDCFIGARAIILKGTRIGAGSVVAAGAVVSGVFPEGAMIVGNPAVDQKTR